MVVSWPQVIARRGADGVNSRDINLSPVADAGSNAGQFVKCIPARDPGYINRNRCPVVVSEKI